MKKTIILATLFLLLTSCNQNNFWETKKIEENKISNTKIVENTKELGNKNDSETSSEWQIDKKNNLNTKEKKETMTKKENIQTAPLKSGDLVATMKTTNGTIKIKLFNDIVPNTVKNFVGLAKQGYYNGIILF